MTFSAIVSEVMNRLNLSSTDAQTRIGQFVNQRYRQLTSSLGLITSRRITSTLTIDPTDTDTYPNLPELTLASFEKVFNITTTGNGDVGEGVLTLQELTYDEITSHATYTRVPRAWAVKTITDSSVTIILDSVTATDTFPLTIEGYSNLTDLSGSNVPSFPADFHDILLEGAMADELHKMEKPQLALLHEQKFESRLSDLRMFIAKSAFLDQYQGKQKSRQSYYWPWFTRVGLE